MKIEQYSMWSQPGRDVMVVSVDRGRVLFSWVQYNDLKYYALPTNVFTEKYTPTGVTLAFDAFGYPVS